MNTTPSTNIKTKPELKAKAEKVAKELGTDLISVVNDWLRRFIKNRTTDLSEPRLVPTPYLKRIIKKARENRKKGKHSPVFSTGEEAVAWLEKQGI